MDGLCVYVEAIRFLGKMKFASVMLALLLAACAARPANTSMTDSVKPDSLKPIAEVLANHTSDWMNIPGVTGTGEGEKDGKPAILIFIDTRTDSLRSQLPATVDGYSVVIEVSGTVNAR